MSHRPGRPMRSTPTHHAPPSRPDAVFVESRAAMGGDDAARFCGELRRAHLRYADRSGWKVEIVEETITGPELVRSSTLRIAGRGVERLFAEAGTHRVTRIPTNDRAGRRHTSAVTVAVLAVPLAVDYALDLRDVAITTFRSSGAGGQNVQKTESAVRVVHRPSGLTAVVQDERSQTTNRARALEVLAARVAHRASSAAAGEQRAARAVMHGSGHISERARSYLWREGVAVDHRTGVRVPLDRALAGELGAFADA